MLVQPWLRRRASATGADGILAAAGASSLASSDVAPRPPSSPSGTSARRRASVVAEFDGLRRAAEESGSCSRPFQRTVGDDAYPYPGSRTSIPPNSRGPMHRFDISWSTREDDAAKWSPRPGSRRPDAPNAGSRRRGLRRSRTGRDTSKRDAGRTPRRSVDRRAALAKCDLVKVRVSQGHHGWRPSGVACPSSRCSSSSRAARRWEAADECRRGEARAGRHRGESAPRRSSPSRPRESDLPSLLPTPPDLCLPPLSWAASNHSTSARASTMLRPCRVKG